MYTELKYYSVYMIQSCCKGWRFMLDILRKQFLEKQDRVMKLIDSYADKYNLDWPDVCVFGSFARDEATGRSDLDIAIIAEKPDSIISGNLREEADILGADIVFITKENFLNGTGLLSRTMRRDSRFIRGGEWFEK